MTDCDFLERVLADGQPHSLNEILRRSFAERGHGLTVHSRAADLRKRGLNVANWKDGDRGNGSWYQLGTSEGADLTKADRFFGVLVGYLGPLAWLAGYLIHGRKPSRA